MPLPEVVVTAFTRAGVTVPSEDRVDRLGYSAEELTIITKELKRRHKEAGDDIYDHDLR